MEPTGTVTGTHTVIDWPWVIGFKPNWSPAVFSAVVIPVCPNAAVVVCIETTGQVAFAHVEHVELVMVIEVVATPQEVGTDIVYVPGELVFGVTAPVVELIVKPDGVAE